MPRLGIEAEDQVWFTFDNALSRGLLRGRRVVYVPYVAPRDLIGTLRIRRMARDLAQGEQFDLGVSTGAIPGVAALHALASRGIPTHFIESAARAAGPSLSGKIAARLPRVNTYSQYPAWSSRRWAYRGSIYDAFRVADEHPSTAPLRRAVVTVGTTEGYSFLRLFRRLVPLLRDLDEVLWQSGEDDLESLGVVGRPSIPHDEMQAAIREADVVISHCGTGSALTALEAGRCPVLVPRWARYGEHVDDHQIQIGRELERRGLAVLVEADEISLDHLVQASSRRIVPTVPPRFDLEG